MKQVIGNSWPLLLGMLFLMIGNGLQGTMIGVRGAIEGFSTFQLSLVTSGYFLGFLGGSRMAPELIRRVGHVRVFAALGSFISAILIMYPTITDPWAWVFLRVLIGFCFSGVYVTAESWLNNAASNEHRGQALSAYMIVQVAGIVIAQGVMNLGDPAEYMLFVVASVLVSISFAPILLSISPTPAFGTAKQMSLRELYQVSPLGFVGMALLGAVFSAQFGMAAVYGTLAGYSVAQISGFISTFFIGALVLQYPIGWISDRMDRRLLILQVGAVGCGASVLGFFFGQNFEFLLAVAFLVGGMTNPLYALLIAYTNDYIQYEDMAAASGGLIFVNGIGAISGPIVTGWMMARVGPKGFWVFIAVLMLAISVYAAWRMTRRRAIPVDETGSYAPIGHASTVVAVEVAQEVFHENVLEDETIDNEKHENELGS